MGCTPLHIAIQRGSTSVIEQLVEYGADVNAVNASDLSPLYLTIMYRDYFDVPSNACPKLKKVSKWFHLSMEALFCVLLLRQALIPTYVHVNIHTLVS